MWPSMRPLGVSLLLLVLCSTWGVEALNATFFTQRLLQQYGSGEQLNATQAQKLLLKVRQVNAAGGATGGGGGHGGSHGGGGVVVLKAGRPANCSFTDATCLSTKCLSAADLYDFHQVPQGGADGDQVAALAPGLLYQLQNEACLLEEEEEPPKKLSDASVWGYSFLAVTVINICPVLGIFFYPLMKTRFYKKVMMWMVGLAVGSLSASAIIVLIPEGFLLLTDESPFEHIFRWRGLMVIGGLFAFFNIERALAFIFQRKERAEARSKRKDAQGRTNKGFEGNMDKHDHSRALSDVSERRHSHAALPPEIIVKRWAPYNEVKPVAWMIIIGDALHNFMDGLSIGAAFTESPAAGLGISLAIFSEELPHELGDFAILLNAGMSLRQAAAMNFISAISCYIGLIAGIQIGGLTDGSYWVFSLTGGMFLYISLVEMLPEMNEQAKEEEEETGHVAVVFILQNFGMVLGWILIFLVSYFSYAFPGA